MWGDESYRLTCVTRGGRLNPPSHKATAGEDEKSIPTADSPFARDHV